LYHYLLSQNAIPVKAVSIAEAGPILFNPARVEHHLTACLENNQ
jgi:2-oxoglutarate ferredoxin oxidoreductase subunit alpha